MKSKLNISEVRRLYQSGMTQEEVASCLSVGQATISLFMKRNGIVARVAAKRDQRGPNNDSWKGESVKYKPAHNRVYAARGRPQQCEQCGSTDSKKRYEWANVSGAYHDPADYVRLCRSCHCKRDGLIKNLGRYAKEPRHGLC